MTASKIATVVLVSALLAGCTHLVTLTPQDGVGAIGRGEAPAPLVSYSGTMRVELEGKTYNGEWSLQKDGGFVGTGFTSGAGGFATGTMFGQSTNGNGKAYLTEPGGSSLRCQFSYSEASGTGIGVCQLSGAAGKLYDLMIK